MADEGTEDLEEGVSGVPVELISEEPSTTDDVVSEKSSDMPEICSGALKSSSIGPAVWYLFCSSFTFTVFRL